MRRVTAAVVWKEGRVLLMRRAPGQNNARCWEFPGGKMEAGETPQACLEREMNEETGVRGRAGACVACSDYAYPGGAIRLQAYEFTILEGEITLRVHDAMRFVAPREALEMALSPADVAIARTLAEEKQ